MSEYQDPIARFLTVEGLRADDVLPRHSLSAMWPDLSHDEEQALIADVSQVGVQIPITIHEGQVLDGWQRYSAARRHIGPKARKAIVRNVEAWRPRGASQGGEGATADEIATATGSSRRTIQRDKARAALEVANVRARWHEEIERTKELEESVRAEKAKVRALRNLLRDNGVNIPKNLY